MAVTTARVPLSLYLLFLPVWFLLSIGVMMAAANSESSWAGVGILLDLGYPVAVLVSAVASRSALRHGRPRAAQAWSLLPAPWVVAGTAVLVWAMSSR